MPNSIEAHIVKSTGPVVVERNGQKITLNEGDGVYESDVIITGDDVTADLEFRDGTRSRLAPNTEIRLTDFEFGPGEDPSFLVELAEGAMRTVSGEVVKLNPDAFEVVTPRATVGIRGTDFVVSDINGVATYGVFFIGDGHTMSITTPDGSQVVFDSPMQLVELINNTFTNTETLSPEQMAQIINSLAPSLSHVSEEGIFDDSNNRNDDDENANDSEDDDTENQDEDLNADDNNQDDDENEGNDEEAPVPQLSIVVQENALTDDTLNLLLNSGVVNSIVILGEDGDYEQLFSQTATEENSNIFGDDDIEIVFDKSRNTLEFVSMDENGIIATFGGKTGYLYERSDGKYVVYEDGQSPKSDEVKVTEWIGSSGSDSFNGGTMTGSVIDLGAGNDSGSIAVLGTDPNTRMISMGRMYEDMPKPAVILGEGDDTLTIGTMHSGYVDAGNGNDSISIDTLNGGIVSLGDDAGSDSLSIGTLNGGIVGLGDGNNSLSITNYNGGQITLGSNDDSISIQNWANNGQTINLGDGNDFLYVGQSGAVSNKIYGGEGVDIISTTNSSTVTKQDDVEIMVYGVDADQVQSLAQLNALNGIYFDLENKTILYDNKIWLHETAYGNGFTSSQHYPGISISINNDFTLLSSIDVSSGEFANYSEANGFAASDGSALYYNASMQGYFILSTPMAGFTKVTSLTLGAEDNSITIDSVNGTNGKVLLDTGAGNDLFNSAGFASGTVNLGDGNDSANVTMSGSSVLNSGAGNDNIELYLSDSAKVYTGSGDDVVKLDGPGGFLDMGDGNDTLNFSDYDSYSRIDVEMGAGDDTVNLNSSAYFGDATLSTGSGNDYIEVLSYFDGSSGGRFYGNLNAGTGDDFVYIDSSATLDSGENIKKYGSFDGGDGLDIINLGSVSTLYSDTVDVSNFEIMISGEGAVDIKNLDDLLALAGIQFDLVNKTITYSTDSGWVKSSASSNTLIWNAIVIETNGFSFNEVSDYLPLGNSMSFIEMNNAAITAQGNLVLATKDGVADEYYLVTNMGSAEAPTIPANYASVTQLNFASSSDDLNITFSGSIVGVATDENSDASIVLGSGNDSLSVSGSVVDTIVDTGAGNDKVEIASFGYTQYSEALNYAKLSTGAGDDTVDIVNFGGSDRGTSIIETGAGKDVVKISYARSGDSTSVDLGDGNDVLRITAETDNTGTTFDGGDGIDIYIASNSEPETLTNFEAKLNLTSYESRDTSFSLEQIGIKIDDDDIILNQSDWMRTGEDTYTYQGDMKDYLGGAFSATLTDLVDNVEFAEEAFSSITSQASSAIIPA